MPRLGQVHLVGFFVQSEVARGDHTFSGSQIHFTFLARQMRHHLVHGQIGFGVVFCLAADDQGCAGFVDQNRVHLIDDRVIEFALHPVCSLVHHVVTQIIKAVFVVGAVGDVTAVGVLFFLAGQLRQIDANTQAEEVVQTSHPLRIAVGQVIVDRDHMHTQAG